MKNLIKDERLNPISNMIDSNLARGELVDFSTDGYPLVTYPGREEQPVEAQVTGFVRQRLQDLRSQTPLKVLLAFVSGLEQPVIIDTIETAPFTQHDDSHYIKATNISMEANEQLVLRCGEAVIVLRGDGKLFFRGVEVTSRAMRKNKLRGAKIEFN